MINTEGLSLGEFKGKQLQERKYNYIAVDFDGTLCEHEFPEIGRPCRGIIEFVRSKHAEGSKIILYTCRDDRPERQYLQEAIVWCMEHNIPIDAVNETRGSILERVRCMPTST